MIEGGERKWGKQVISLKERVTLAHANQDSHGQGF